MVGSLFIYFIFGQNVLGSSVVFDTAFQKYK